MTAETIALSGPLVLVDDNEDDLALMQHLLKKSGLTSDMVTFRGGDEAVEALERRATGGPRLAAFCLDVKMPGMTGIALLEWIRGRREFDGIPVLMCSTSEDPRDIDGAARHGAQAYVVKYPKPEAMRELLQQIHGYAQGQRSPRGFEVSCNLLLGRDPMPEAVGSG